MSAAFYDGLTPAEFEAQVRAAAFRDAAAAVRLWAHEDMFVEPEQLADRLFEMASEAGGLR